MTRCADSRARVANSFNQLLQVHKARHEQAGQTLVIDPQVSKATNDALRAMESVAVRESLLAIMDGIGAILEEIDVKIPPNGKRSEASSVT